MAYSEHLLGVQPLFAPVYLLTGNATLAMNLWLMATFVLSGLAMYWTAHRWLGSPLAAAVAALAWCFAPWRFTQLSHAQILSVQYLPPLLWASWRAVEQPSARTWIAVFALTTLQVLSSYYLGYMAFAAAGVSMATSLVFAAPPRWRRFGLAASALLAAALLLVPVSLPYLQLKETEIFGFRIPAAFGAMREFLLPHVQPGSTAAWREWKLLPWLALLGAWLGLRSPRQRPFTLALLALAVIGTWLGMTGQATVLGLRIGALDDLLKAIVPGWSGLRVRNRFGILPWLSLCLLAALPFGMRLLDLRLAWARRALAAGFALALVISSARMEIRTLPSPEHSGDLAPYRWLAKHGKGDPLLEWPMATALQESRYMLASTHHWLPMVNGYSGYWPPSRRMLVALAGSLPEQAATRSLIRLNVARWLLVHHPRLGGGLRRWNRLLASGAKLRFEAPGVRIYELPFRHGERAALQPPAPGQTLLGTDVHPLRRPDLEARVAPLIRRIRDPLGLGIRIPFRLQNHSKVPWPGLAVPRKGLVGARLWARPAGSGEAAEPLRDFQRLPTDLGPGQSCVVWMNAFLPLGARGAWQVFPCLEQAGVEGRRCHEGASVQIAAGGAR